MKVAEVISEAAVPVISLQQARDSRMFGPIYHGTGADLSQIVQTGFDPGRSVPSAVNYMNMPVGSANGYTLDSYGYTGIAAPVHHLGFGVYFTTVKAIAKQFAGGTMRGMKVFYLESQNIEQINFGAPNTMMKWWMQNGYNMTAEATKARDMQAWIAATQNLTNTLSSRCDAVWFLGKGIRKLLDGDQICVYRPELIRLIDPKMSSGLEVGAKVVATGAFPNRYKGSNDFYMDDLKPTDFGSYGKLGALGQGWKGIFRASAQEEHDAFQAQRTQNQPWNTPVSFMRSPIHVIPPAGMTGTITVFGGGAGEPQYDNPNKTFHVKWSRGGVMYNYSPEEIQTFTPGSKTRAGT